MFIILIFGEKEIFKVSVGVFWWWYRCCGILWWFCLMLVIFLRYISFLVFGFEINKFCIVFMELNLLVGVICKYLFFICICLVGFMVFWVLSKEKIWFWLMLRLVRCFRDSFMKICFWCWLLIWILFIFLISISLWISILV